MITAIKHSERQEKEIMSELVAADGETFQKGILIKVGVWFGLLYASLFF
jgi:hypothetical protein